MVSEAAQSSVLSLARSHSRELALRCRMLFDVAELGRSIADAFRQTLARHHLTEIGLTVLATLTAHEGITAAEVARDTGLPRRTACHALAQLELAGLLAFERAPGDPGQSRVRCTPLGRDVCTVTLKACLDTALRLTASLDPEQAATTADTVHRMCGRNPTSLRS